MKITAVETIELAEFPFLFWLRLHTDDELSGMPLETKLADKAADLRAAKD